MWQASSLPDNFVRMNAAKSTKMESYDGQVV